MSILDRIAQGINIDPLGGYLRGRMASEQFQQQREQHSLAQQMGAMQVEALEQQLQDRDVSTQALGQFGRASLSLLSEVDTPEATHARNQISAGLQALGTKQGNTLIASGTKAAQQIVGTPKIVATFTAINEGTGRPEVYTRDERGNIASTGLEAKQGGQTINVGTGDGNSNVLTSRVLAKLGDDYVSQVETAQSVRTNVAEFKALQAELEGGIMEPGFLTPFIERGAAFFEAVGVPLSDAQRQQLGTAQGLHKLQMDFVFDFIRDTKGAISNKEMAQFMRASPGLGRTPEANEIMLDIMDRAADFQLTVLEKQAEYFERDGATVSGWVRFRKELWQNDFKAYAPGQKQALVGMGVLVPEEFKSE